VYLRFICRYKAKMIKRYCCLKKSGGKTLLIVEDDPVFSGLLKEIATRQGFRVQLANNGEDGLQTAIASLPAAIILDLNLPGISGSDVMKALKENRKTRHIPIHIISGMEENIEFLNMGAMGYLTKPATTTDLLKAFSRIERLLKNKVKQLLVVEQAAAPLDEIAFLGADKEVKVTRVHSLHEAGRLLQSGIFDCLIIDPEIEYKGAIELLQEIGKDDNLKRLPILLYHDKIIHEEFRQHLASLKTKIPVKEITSSDHLLDQVSLFLHRIVQESPEHSVFTGLKNKKELLVGEKVLIVDDDMRNVFALTSILEEHGVEVLVAKNGKECLAVLKENMQIDLVLMDIMLPVMNGYETMKEIRSIKRFSSLPIIALTAKAMKDDRQKCIEAGASDYMAKPIHADRLLSLLKVWLYS